ncbi:erythrocyte membrane protein 1, PfEMP1, putative [Plasmodium sp. DRC-Itaito]|nr:erythrocyte membrane protein 1, PfEMP1, putative [Plasmodium sp. DRC-Itaito]
MGNTESNEKSSLLKNFQYLIDTKNGTTKLLYFDYLNFLHYELQHEAWKWGIYSDYVKQNVGVGSGALSNHDFFCGWKKIQHEIFKKLTQVTGTTTYNWENDVEPLINIKGNTEFTSSPQGCNNVTIKDKEITELKNADFPALSGTSSPPCTGLITSKDIHVPLRRRALLVAEMYNYLEEIKDEIKNIQDQNKLQDVLKSKNITIGSNTEAFNLTKELIEGIAKTFGDFIYKKHNDHSAFCKEWERTMNDYYTLLLGNDIVDEDETKKIQCTIKQIETNMGEKNFKSIWRQHFRDLAEQLRKKKFAHQTTGNTCEVDQSDKSQCVRFFEEWAEEFCKLKKVLGEMIVSQCKDNTNVTSNECKGVCKIYRNLIEVSEPYFKNYKNTCADKKYGNKDQTEDDLRNSFINAAANSTTDCCTEFGNCSPEELFNVQEDKGNIKYKCFCPEGEYKKDSRKDTDNKCSKLKNPGISNGIQVPPPTLATAGQTTTSGTTPNCDKNNTCGFGTFIKENKFNELSNKSNCCGLKSHVNGKGIKWRNNKDKDYEYLTKKDFEKEPVPEQVYLPPRKQNLCFKDLDNTKFTTTDDLKSQLMKVSVTEGYNLGEYYKEKNAKKGDTKYNYDVSPCNALKYSFYDLRDIILGYDMLEPAGTETEKNIKKLIENGGQNNKTDRKQWWNQNKTCVWKAMLCGYKKGNDTTLSGCDQMPDDTTYPVGTTRDSGTKFQFLRWTKEWSEDFCTKRKQLADKVVSACDECKKASDTYHKNNSVDKNSGAPGKQCGDNGKSDPDCGDCKDKCQECKDACTAYKNFVSSTSGNNWRQQWQQMDTKYRELMENAKKKLEKYHEDQQQKKTPSTSDSTRPYMEKCSENGVEKECVKNDIHSFFQNLHETGMTTLSSYISKMSTTTCGNDMARWNKTTRDTSGGGDVLPEVFGDKPVGFKYACQCRIPSREELCDDGQLYRNRWECSTSAASATSGGANTGVTTASPRARRSTSGNTKYELCKDKSNTGNKEAPQGEIPGLTLDEHDVQFFNLFQQWYKDIQNMLDQNIKRITDECDQQKIMKKPDTSGTTPSVTDPSGGTRSPLCQTCRDSCECYKLWVEKTKGQWDRQQANFTQFENKQKTSGVQSGGNQNDVVDMNKFLFASCWEDYIEEQSRRGKTFSVTDIDKLDVTTHGDMIDVLMDRCGTDKKDAEKKFQERIEKAEKQTKMCDRNQDRCKKVGEELKCDKIGSGGGDVSGCKDKNYDGPMDGKTGTPKKWECGDTSNSKDVCMSPRTQTLCVVNMHPGGNLKIISAVDKDKLKGYIKDAMKTETERLYEYYEKGTPIITTKGENDKSGVPKNFCLAVQRTYNDFKHMVLGDSISKHPIIGDIGKKIKEILEKPNSGSNKTTPEAWWEQNSDKFWDAIKCGIKGKTTNSSSKGDECGVFYPAESDTYSQFVWWFKEWGQEFCVQRQTLIEGINDTCDSNVNKRCNGTTNKTLKQECEDKCKEYKGFIDKSREAWNKQKKKYETENEGKKAEELFIDFPECGETNFETIFDTPTTATTKSSNATYFDASDICSCTEQRYKSDGTHPSWCHPKSNDTAWRTYNVKYGKNGKKLVGVFAPPRRQKLCLANLYPINFGNDTTTGKPGGASNSTDSKKMDIFNRLQMIAEREAFYLWKQYHQNSNNSKTASSGDTDEDKKACCAIRNSFFDIGDIVKGTDLWDDLTKQYIDEKLNEVFKEEFDELEKTGKEPKYPNPIGYLRKKWWEIDATGSGTNRKTKRDSVWDAMQNGVTNALTELNKNGKVNKKSYTEIDCMKDDNNVRNFHIFATPQFVRWLEEWTHQFCQKYEELITNVATNCNGGNDCNSSGKSGKNECKDACTKYTKWINIKKTEWDGMSKYYSTIYVRRSSSESPDGTDYSAIMRPTAIDYLNTRCKNEINGTDKCCFCENIGKENATASTSKSSGGNEKPLEHMDQVVAKNDDRYAQYKRQCTDCQLKHIKEQITKINDKVEARKKEKAKSGSTKQVEAKTPSKSPAAAAVSSKSGAQESTPQAPAPQQQVQTQAGAHTSPGGGQHSGPPGPQGGTHGGGSSGSQPAGVPPVVAPASSGSGTQTSKCKIDEYITDNKSTNVGNGKNYCNPKENAYWDCTNRKIVSGNGECMPPRRQKMCIKYLKDLNGQKNLEELKEALLKSVSLETHFLWEQYKKDHGGVEKQLESGTIPPDFLRTMFYTYSDFRDMCLGNDIGSSPDTKGIVTKVKQILAKQNGTKSPNTTDPSDWWDQNAPDVWEGMLCSLTHAVSGMSDTERTTLKDKNKYDDVTFGDSTTGTSLSQFVSRPQFLRWMTEWGEQFCREYTKELETLRTACSSCTATPATGSTTATCDETKCKGCKAQCEKYNTWLDQWKKNYTTQNTKFKTKKTEYQSADEDVKDSPDARQYLKKKLENMKCTDKSGNTKSCEYDCMNEESKQPQASNSGDKLPQSMDYPPEGYDKKCNCSVTPVVRPPAAAAAKPVATKPEIPRPQAAKPAAVRPPAAAAAKPQVDSPQGAVASSHPPGPPPPPAPVSPQVARSEPSPGNQVLPKAASSTKNCTQPDPEDGGTCQGGHTINTGNQGQGTLSVVNTSITVEPTSQAVPTTTTTTSPTSAPTTSTTSVSGSTVAASVPQNGSAANSGTGQVANAQVTQTQTNRGFDWWRDIVQPALTPALAAGIVGVTGTMGAITTAAKAINTAKDEILTATKVGLQATTDVLEGINKAIRPSPPTNPPSGQGSNTAPAPAPPSGPGSSGNRDPGSSDPSGHVASGSSHTLTQSPQTGGGGSGGGGGGGSLASPQPQLPGTSGQQPTQSQVAVGGQGISTSSLSSGSTTTLSQGTSSHGGQSHTSQTSSSQVQGGASQPQGSPSGKIPIETVVTSSVPLGLSIALGSIALLYYLKVSDIYIYICICIYVGIRFCI